MVIGNGLIANAFESYKNQPNFLIFASGVSNSTANNTTDFDRELGLLTQALATHTNSLLVYFSTCSIYDDDVKNNAYVKHKLKAEKLIIAKAKHYCICRVSNLVGSTNNPTTILNYVANAIKNNTHFYVWLQATRNLLDVADLYLIVDYTLKNKLQHNSIINIANTYEYSMPTIVKQLETHFAKVANYTLVNKGTSLHIDKEYIYAIIDKIPIVFNELYLQNLLQKYYPT